MSTGNDQCRPPSVEVEAVTADSPARLPSMIGRPIWYARPAASNDTHGSVARGRSSCSGVSGRSEQRLNSAQSLM
jgi:hypothetical protein